MKDEIKPINKRIATYRRLAGHTQQTAAEALGMKKNTYARMELHGNPTQDIIIRLASLYNVSANLLLYGTDLIPPTEINKEPPRLEEKPHIFENRPEPVLTTNEKNCIKIVRTFTKEEKNQVMELINNIYQAKKRNG